MEKILIIDHPIECPSFFVDSLVEVLEREGFAHEYKAYTELDEVDHKDYAAVISASGFCKIRGNDELADENELTDRCEAEGTPTLYLPNGAQIKAVHIAGDDAIVESKSPRKGIHSDYETVEDAEADAIFTDIDIDELLSREYHAYDIVKIADPFENLLVDPEGNTILARHKDEHVISYMMQMHPEYVPKPGEEVNSAQLLTNFLSMVRLRDQS